ncbi:hypothetical protein NCS52_00822100 [Fusarium sp. LHS14.1]|nr:hypothetical protein NCS52_00822100 [Fusarium sp. LHS14.1]
MAQGTRVYTDRVMMMMNEIADERGNVWTDHDAKRTMDDKMYHAMHLGKSRNMADPKFAYGVPPHPALKRSHEAQLLDIKHNSGQVIKPGSRAWCAMYGHGRDAMWPPMDPGRPHQEMKSALERQAGKMERAWKDFRHLVVGKERLIQDTDYWKNAWRETIDDYNNNFVEQPDRIGRDYLLDPKGTIADGHSSDLDIFALDFLKDMSEIILTQVHRHYPLYRHGANYKDESQTLAEIRANVLVPHINLRDLLDPYNLLSFIHHRARLVPSEFALLDNDLSYLGRHSMILPGYFDCAVTVSLRVPSANNDETESDRPLRVWPDPDQSLGIGQETVKQHRGLNNAGELFGTTEAFLILQSQTVSYLFLGKLCAALLKEAQGKTPGHSAPVSNPNEEAEALRTIQDLRGNSRERWQDIASIRQYEPIPATLNFERYQQNILSKKDQAEEHIRRLFHEPEYFFQQLLEQKEHHWVNLDISYDKQRDKFIEKYHQDKTMRHILYGECLRNVLRRAVFEYFMWNAVEETLVYVTMDGAKTWSHAKWSTCGKEFQYLNTLYLRVQTMIRYFGVVFVLEFRNKAIHAASQSMRDIFCIKKAPGCRGIGKGARFKRGHYRSDELELCLTKKTLVEDRENLPRIVAELIENFISNKTSSMYMGMRKVTARLQRYLDDCDDEDTAQAFSPLVSNTIDGLDLLAELAEHLELHFPVHRYRTGDIKLTEEAFSNSLSALSIDFMAFDEFEVEKVPEKRRNRLYQYLDEMQGLSTKTINFGGQRSDLKRLGSCLLHTLIYKVNENQKNRARTEALHRLASTMGVTRNQYPFDQREPPMDMDKLENIPQRWPTDQWKSIHQQLLDDEKRRKKEGKKPWKNKGESSKDKDDPVANVQKRMEILKARRQRETDRWNRAKRRQKEKWRRRIAAKSRDAGATSEDDSESESGPAGNGDNAGDIVGGVQQLGIRDQTGLQPPVQRPRRGHQQIPLHPVPPLRQPPTQPRATDVSPPTPDLAPDHRPLGKLNKRVWKTFRSIFGKNDSLVSWEELVRAMNAIGYQDEGRGGSHGVFLRTDNCRWRTEALPKAKNIQLAKYHGGGRKGAPRGKTLDWGTRLAQRGFTWSFFRKWYREKC